MGILAKTREFVARQVRGLGSLVSASVIVLAVLGFAVYSANAGSGQDRMRRAAEEAARSAQAALAAAGRVSQLYISADGLERPVSYMALIRVHGWKNRDQRVIEASVDTVRALDGGVVRTSAASSGSVADAIADQLTGKRILASVDPRIATEMPEDGNAQVRLIVSPQGATATLVIDEVIEPIQLKAAGPAPAGTASTTGSSASPSPGTAPSALAPQPHIRSLSAYVLGPGGIVTISGDEFGSAMGEGRVNCAGVRAEVTHWSDTSISFKVPSGIKRAGYVGVVVKGVASNGVYFSPFSAPVVTSISPQQGAPGTVVTISGRNFGIERDGWVTFAGSTATVMRWSDQTIQVLVPRGVGAGYAGVIAHGMTSNGILYAPYGSPLVTSVNKRLGPGDSVTIRGTHFGGSPGLVALGGKTYQATEWKPDSVTFTVPDSAESGYVGIVLKNGVTSNGFWRSLTPKIVSVSPSSASPGSTITLLGRGFGTQGANTVYVDGVPANGVESWSSTRIVVRVPNASSGYVGVGTPAACSNGAYLLIDRPGRVSGVTPSVARAGDQLTITGSGFESVPGSSRVLIGGAQCAVESWSDTTIVVVLPPTALSGYLGVVATEHVTSNGVWVSVQP